MNLLKALESGMRPIFDYYQSKLNEQDGQTLDIQITVQKHELNIRYGVSPISSSPSPHVSSP